MICWTAGLCGDGLVWGRAPRSSSRAKLGSRPWPQGFRTCYQRLKLQPHFVRSLKPQLFIQGTPLGTGMQIDGAKAPLFEPLQDGHHDLPRNSPLAEFRLRVHVQDHCPLGARVLGIRRPWAEQHPAAGDASRAIQRQPMAIRAIRQSPRQPWPGNFHHAIEFFDGAFPHIAEHRPSVMENDRRLVRRRFSNLDLSLRHFRAVSPGFQKVQ